LHDYYRMVEMADAELGRILGAIAARPDAANTLVLLTADHGDGGAQHQRVQKLVPYDSAAKTPFLVSWPGRLREGVRDATHLVSGVDLMSTVCEYAGVPAPPHARGLSLRPLLEPPQPIGWRTDLFAEVTPAGRMIRTGQFKYVKYYTRQSAPGRPAVEDPVKLLFDMKSDPLELKNLAADPHYAEVIAQHEKILKEQWESKLIPGKASNRN
jgi:choline-sulfatase